MTKSARHKRPTSIVAPTEAKNEVGYRKPPRHSQFQPGKSGNPSGRPRESRNRATLVQQLANEKHTVKSNGRVARHTTAELVLITLRNLALKGDARAGRLFSETMANHLPQPPVQRRAFIVAPEVLSIEEWKVEARKHAIRQARLIEASKLGEERDGGMSARKPTGAA